MPDSGVPEFFTEEVDRVENPINGAIRITYRVKPVGQNRIWVEFQGASYAVPSFDFSVTIGR